MALWPKGRSAAGGRAALRIFRYEVRRWRNGSIPDLQFAVAPPVQLTDQVPTAERVLEVLPSVPTVVWGRNELQTGEMWSCNSIISWALTRAGLDAKAIDLPPHGRAPGWHAGVKVAQRQVPQ